MTTTELHYEFVAAVPSIPPIVLQYLRHVCANKLHVVMGQLEVGMQCKSVAGVMASMVNADKAARGLWDEIKAITKGVEL